MSYYLLAYGNHQDCNNSTLAFKQLLVILMLCLLIYVFLLTNSILLSHMRKKISSLKNSQEIPYYYNSEIIIIEKYNHLQCYEIVKYLMIALRKKYNHSKSICSLKRTKIPNSSFKNVSLAIKYLENHQTLAIIQDSPLGPTILTICVYFIKSFIAYLFLSSKYYNNKSILKQCQQPSVYYPHVRRWQWC